MQFFVDLHEIAVKINYYLIGIHLVAAVYHRLLRQHVWSTVEPFWQNQKAFVHSLRASLLWRHLIPINKKVWLYERCEYAIILL